MNAADVIAYVTDGQIICANCADDELTGGKGGRTPDDVGVIFAGDETGSTTYCDGVAGCGHSLDCTSGGSNCEKCFPTSRDSSRAVRKSLPEDCRKAVTRAIREDGALFAARVRESVSFGRTLRTLSHGKREVVSVAVCVRQPSKSLRRELQDAGFRELDSWRYEWTA